MKTGKGIYIILLMAISLLFVSTRTLAQAKPAESELDKKVNDFLKKQASMWRDMNVPATDGKLLYDIIMENKYKSGVEIGTSTGHSSIWLAWALSKNGGKLITFEIDERRYKEALSNFEKAGLSNYIDARLGDAHDLVTKLNEPIDFVFSDADKDWYTNYFKALDLRLVVGGCFTAHNIEMSGAREFYEYISNLPNYKTMVDNRGAGMSISYKTGK
jgi:predicted O-methyltransferase YrrM